METILPSFLLILWTVIQGAAADLCLYSYRASYTYKYCYSCCGSYGAAYCCSDYYWGSGQIAGSVIGGIIVLGIVIAFIVCLIMNKSGRHRTTPVINNTNVNTTTTTPMHSMSPMHPPPYTGGPATYSDPAYPPQPRPYPGLPNPHDNPPPYGYWTQTQQVQQVQHM